MAAEKNTLEIGQSRIGWLIDGRPETPQVAVKLDRTADEVEMTIPFGDDSDPYQYWFSSGVMYADDPDRSKRRYEPPETVSFHDARGSMALVGSRAFRSTRTWGGPGIGEGRLHFDFTVLGAFSGPAFRTINGLRSEVEGLGTWIGLRSMDAEQKLNAAGRLDAVTLRLQSSPAIRATRVLNAQFQSNWRYAPGPGPDQTTISERMHVHTQVRSSKPWQHHLTVHFALRDLLRVAAWRRLQFVSHEAMSSAEPLRTMDGVSHGEQWLPVITSRTGIANEARVPLSAQDFLFSFADVGSVGVGRWVDLSRKLERGLEPLVRLLELKGASLQAHLAQVGIGFETLGYELTLASGISKSQADSHSWEERVRAVTSTTASVLPFSEDEFVDLLRRNYRAVKHADNARPDERQMHLAYRQAIQVFRTWVASRLGVPNDSLRRALERDHVTRHVRAIERAMRG